MAARPGLDEPSRRAECERPDVLDAVLRPDVDLAIWRRRPDPALAAWADGLTPGIIPDGRVLVSPDMAKAALLSLLQEKGTPGTEGAGAFLEDAVALVRRFSEISRSDLVDIRVEHVRHDACWKFHRDCVPLRLICTYRGPGTELVPACHAEEALERQRAYTGPLEQISRFAVALFKGSLGSPSGVVHRSPPIAGRGISRLVLCLNTPSAASPAPYAELRAAGASLR